jgi:putative ABC transport system ATP-binding protein
MTHSVVQARDVEKVLGAGPAQVQALAEVNLTLNSRELTLLMGPSGSGKTTLLSVLGCMLTPSRGTVRIAGHSIEGLTPEDLAKVRRDHVGFVFQSYHLFPTLTALDNVRLALDVRAERPRIAKSKANEALARVGLAHKRGSYPRELSGGEQQRVAIARAVVASPSVILADEPTAALDGENGQAIMTILTEIARNLGSSVLVVTHDPRLIRFAGRIVHIEDGRIVGEQPGGASPSWQKDRGKDRTRAHPFAVVRGRPN